MTAAPRNQDQPGAKSHRFRLFGRRERDRRERLRRRRLGPGLESLEDRGAPMPSLLPHHGRPG
jgi:hypothetical protein